MIFSVAVLFCTAPISSPEADRLWEERIILIMADSPDDARVMAETIARNHEFEYENAQGTMLATRFGCIERVFTVSEELKNGCELFSRFLRDSEVQSILTPFDD